MIKKVLILVLLGFAACNSPKSNKIKGTKDSTVAKKDTAKEPENFESIHQLEYEQHKLKKQINKTIPPQKIKF